MARQSRAPNARSAALPVPVLLTRPLPQALHFAGQLEARFGPGMVRAVISPLMAPRFIPLPPPSLMPAALILTSGTGAEAARQILADGVALPDLAFCVGEQTARLAAAAGLRTVSARGDADALVALIAADPPPGLLLHLCGRETRGDVVERLQSMGIAATAATAYAQEPRPPSPEAAALLAGNDPLIVPLFSPRSAVLFAALAPRAPLHLAAISPAVAGSIAPLRPERLAIAARPDADAMLDVVADLLRDISAA